MIHATAASVHPFGRRCCEDTSGQLPAGGTGERTRREPGHAVRACAPRDSPRWSWSRTVTLRDVVVRGLRTLGAARGRRGRQRRPRRGPGLAPVRPATSLVVEVGLPDGSGIALLAELRSLGWHARHRPLRRRRPLLRARRAGRRRPRLPRHRRSARRRRPGPAPAGGAGSAASRACPAREIEVLQLVADGRSNKDIGEALGLSALTVKSHLARIARKLGTGDRAEMVVVAMRAGVIASRPPARSRRPGSATSPDARSRVPARHAAVPRDARGPCRASRRGRRGDAARRGARRPDAVPLLEPRDGVPAPVDRRPRARAQPSRRFAAGTGPVAVDAERASGYRYGQRAYLVQLRRAGAGTVLIDPRRLPDLSHARRRARATPSGCCTPPARTCPAWPRSGMRPTRLFDTELAGRLAGLPAGRPRAARRGGARASPWRRATRRPTGRPGRCPSRGCATPRWTSRCWSSCATRSPPSSTSRASSGWAEQEFAAIVAAPPAAPRVDPWRRTSGMHRVRGAAQLAVVRALWEAPRRVARRRDIAPGRVLPDTAIVEAALAAARRRGRAGRAARFCGRRRRAGRLDPGCRRIAAACALPDDELPDVDAAPATARRRPGAGPTATRPPRPGWPPPGPRSRRSPTSTGCRSRTCSPPTPSGGCAGRRPTTSPRTSVAERSCAGTGPALAGGADRAGARPRPCNGSRTRALRDRPAGSCHPTALALEQVGVDRGRARPRR